MVKTAETIDIPWFVRRTPAVLPQFRYCPYHMPMNGNTTPAKTLWKDGEGIDFPEQ
jgi:hypothetical protein